MKTPARLYVGLDIGGTKMLAAAATTDGRTGREIHAATPADFDEGLLLLYDLIAQAAANHPIAAIGIAIGGPLDHHAGIVSPLHQPQWRNVPLGKILSDRYSCPVYIDVDTNVAALGEYAARQGRVDRLLYLTISTGMGGGLVIDGQVYRGAGGAHPEVAHQAIPMRCRYPDRVRCECGADDCLEALVSGNGIRRVYGKPASALSDDEWMEVALHLGIGLRNMAALYAPAVIALGGGVALGGGDRLLAPAAAEMRRGLRIVPAPQVSLSRLGHRAPLTGAIHLAMEGETG